MSFARTCGLLRVRVGPPIAGLGYKCDPCFCPKSTESAFICVHCIFMQLSDTRRLEYADHTRGLGVSSEKILN